METGEPIAEDKAQRLGEKFDQYYDSEKSSFARYLYAWTKYSIWMEHKQPQKNSQRADLKHYAGGLYAPNISKSKWYSWTIRLNTDESWVRLNQLIRGYSWIRVHSSLGGGASFVDGRRYDIATSFSSQTFKTYSKG